MEIFVLTDNCRPGRMVYDTDIYEDALFSCLKLHGDIVLERIKEELYGGVDLEACYCGVTFLGAACWLGRDDVVGLVINYIHEMKNTDHSRYQLSSSPSHYFKRRSLLDAYDNNGYTPLILAISGGHLEICRMLIESGADVNLHHQMSKQTPLIIAIEQSQDDILSYLLDNGADVQITDNVGISPLYVAIKSRKESVVKQLIDADCDVDVGSQDHAPIFLATRMGQLNIVKMLCQAKCHKDISNKYGVTPVYEAAMKGHQEVLQYLLDEECSPNRVDMYDQSPLHVAVMSSNINCAKLLVEAGANWKLRNHNGETAMDFAMATGKADILEYFMEEGIDILPKRSNQRSLKNIVAVFENGHVSTLQLLIQCCAKLPILHCINVIPVFRSSGDLLKLLLLSGNQTVPSTLLAVDSHPCKEVSDWLKNFHRNPRSLQDICRIRVRRTLGNKVLYKSKLLPLPTELKHFITMKQDVVKL